MNQPVSNAIEFVRGQQDCKEGVPHKPNQPSDYDRGYSTEYAREQVASELNRKGVKQWI